MGPRLRDAHAAIDDAFTAARQPHQLVVPMDYITLLLGCTVMI
jgi:hypothetical protein